MIDSNLYTLQHYRLKPSERERRIEYLEKTIKQLQNYHKTAPRRKKGILKALINRYQSFIYSVKE